jgi:hypothetical protein
VAVVTRLATERGLDELVQFKVEFAYVSFAERAVTYPQAHPMRATGSK